MGIPTDAEIRALHERHAPTPEAFELVFTHCEIVWALAEPLVGGAVDADLVRAGCLLHDIGVHLLDGQPYIRHGVLGHTRLRELGLPEEVSRFCSHHTGVGISRADVVAQGLPLPAGDYLAETPEEQIVMYADKFHSKSTPPVFLTADSYAARVRRFGVDKEMAFRAMVQKFGEPDVPRLAARFGHPVV